MKRHLADSDLYELARDDLTSTMCWISRNNHCMPHFHTCVELLYVVEGEVTAILDGQAYAASAGQMILVSPYAVHAFRTEAGKENQVILVTIPLSSVPSLQKTLNKKNFSSVVYEGGRDQEISTLLPLMADHWADYRFAARKGFSYILLGQLIDKVGLKHQSASHRSGLMREVLVYLEENYQQPLHMEGLARQFGYSKSRFSRLFHDHLGCSMIDYLAALRCRRAAQLLLESDMTMLDIAMNVGFECLRTFYRAFKGCYDMTPTQYIHAHMAK